MVSGIQVPSVATLAFSLQWNQPNYISKLVTSAVFTDYPNSYLPLGLLLTLLCYLSRPEIQSGGIVCSRRVLNRSNLQCTIYNGHPGYTLTVHAEIAANKKKLLRSSYQSLFIWAVKIEINPLFLRPRLAQDQVILQGLLNNRPVDLIRMVKVKGINKCLDI